ncbi:hypothetical protein Tco_1443597, partial [Tanacetum coccineum]
EWGVKGRAQENGERDTNPVLVLDDSCVNKQDYSCCLNGKIKEFGALANLKVVLENEGFTDIDLRYLGGLWVMIVFKSVEVKNKFSSCAGSGSWFSQLIQASSDFIIDGRVTWVEIEGVPLKVWNENTFKRIASKWGTLLTVENSEEDHLHSKRLCVYMKGMSNIFESFKITYQGKAYWVCAKEIPGWTPDFDEHNDEDSDSDDEQFEGVFKEDIGGSDEEVQGENDVSVVPDTVVEKTNPKFIDGDGSSDQIRKQSANPFNIYYLLNKNKLKENKESNTNENLKYPPGFTPSEDVEVNGQMDNQRMSFDCEKGNERNVSDEINSNVRYNRSKKEGMKYVGSRHFKKSEVPRTGGSLLMVMEELIKVGQTMGYNMEGCTKNIEEIIESQGVDGVLR